MTNQLLTPEALQTPTISVEPLSDTVLRIKRESVIAVAQPGEPADAFYKETGDGVWIDVSFAPGDPFRQLDPSHVEDGLPIERAEDAMQSDISLATGLARRRAAWWSLPLVEMGDAAPTGVADMVRLTYGDDQVDILNFSSQQLSEVEVNDLEVAMRVAIHFTQGKVLDRLNGIALLPASAFRDEMTGRFIEASQAVVLNIEKLREQAAMLAASPDIQKRFARYFPDGGASLLTFIALHEIGHAMDVRRTDEVLQLGVDSVTAVGQAVTRLAIDSHFQTQPGWRQEQAQANGVSATHRWRWDEAGAIEHQEYPMTYYGHESPKEDYAEAFAIAALGGDLTQIPQRQKVMLASIENANGRIRPEASVAAHHVTESNEPIRAQLKPVYTVAAYTATKE